MKKILIALVLAASLPLVSFADVPSAGRSWTYVNFTTLLSPHWAFVFMPGARFEFNRSNGSTKDTYFYEWFGGPVYTFKTGAFTVKLPLWYYYMGYPVKSTDSYYFSHNIEFLPIVEYRHNNWTFVNRVIFHNTLYASVYGNEEQRNGYGLVIREMVQASYAVNKQLSVLLADEPFFGVIEDKEAPVSGPGYWAKGFRLNRVYAGVDYKVTPLFSVSPQYILETTYDTNGGITEIDHYLYLTLTYVFKLFK
jgi:hypothetical protein